MFVSNVLILGFTDAVFAFTKIVAPVVKWLRCRGWKGLVYIDDFFTRGKTWQECQYFRNLLLSTLNRAGLSVNKNKSQNAQDNAYSLRPSFACIFHNSSHVQVCEYNIPHVKLARGLLVVSSDQQFQREEIKEKAWILGWYILWLQVGGRAMCDLPIHTA